MSKALELDRILDWLCGFLGTSCDPQLRLVSKNCNTVMEKWTRGGKDMRDYLSSAALFNWAVNELRMPVAEDICEKAARGGHLTLLQSFRATPSLAWKDNNIQWDEATCSSAAQGGQLHVLQWLRAQDPPCPWDQETCEYAAWCGNLHVLLWLRAQDLPCPWDKETCNAAAWGGNLRLLQWLRAQDPPCPWDDETASHWGPLL
jgi:hypothetical protein